LALAQKAATRTRAEPGTDSGSDTDSRAGTIADAAARTSTRADTNACARTDAGAVARADADSNAGSGSQANTCADSDANTNACANSCADADSGAYTNTCAYTNTGTNTRAGSVVEHQPSNFRRGRCNDVRRLSNAARQRRQGRNVQRRFARGSTAIGHEPLSERNTFGWFSRCKPGRRGLVHLLRTRHLSFSGTPRTA